MADKTLVNAEGYPLLLKEAGTLSGQTVYALTTIEVDSNGVAMSSPNGRAAAASSRPVVLSNEDFAELKRASTGATVSVASSATAVTLKAANANRIGLTIANDSTAILYVLLGAGTVSSTNYTYALPAKGTTAADRTITGFTGIVTGVWASANGSALVTELT